MRAVAVTPGIAGSARLIELPDPEPGPGQVRVRVQTLGIDATDQEIDRGGYGEAPAGEDFLILGHEAVGRVDRVGPGVTALQLGDLVVPTVRRPDGCPNCRAGESDMCLWGGYAERGIKGRHGYAADYLVEEPIHLVRLPAVLAALGELLEPLSVVEKAVEQIYRIQRRLVWEPRTAVVLGAGQIGLFATMLLIKRGLDVYTLARGPATTPQGQIVQAAGGVYFSTEKHPIPKLADELGNVDVIVEATGVSRLVYEAMGVLGTNGVLCLLGVYGGDRPLEVPADRLDLRLVLGNRLVFGSVNSNRSHFEAGVDDLREFERRWPGLVGRIVTRRLPLDQFKVALRGETEIKCVIDVAR